MVNLDPVCLLVYAVSMTRQHRFHKKILLIFLILPLQVNQTFIPVMEMCKIHIRV